MIAARATLAALALALSACTGSTPSLTASDPERTTASQPQSTTPIEIPVVPTTKLPNAATPSTASPTAPPATSRTAAPPAGTNPKKWAPLEVALSATCLRRGDELIVTARTEPFSGIGFAVGYSEPPEGAERIVPDYAYFDRESNPTGTISWSFVVRPSVPYGPGVVKVVVNGHDGKGAFEEAGIEVAPSCR